jgi:hypothetical protein
MGISDMDITDLPNAREQARGLARELGEALAGCVTAIEAGNAVKARTYLARAETCVRSLDVALDQLRAEMGGPA